MLPFHIQIKSCLLRKTWHRLYTYFALPFLCDSLSNLMKPSNWLADISDDADDYVTVYSEGKFMGKNMKEQNARFLQLLALLSQQYLRFVSFCFLNSMMMFPQLLVYDNLCLSSKMHITFWATGCNRKTYCHMKL